jgi:hypothetical protein
VSYFKDLDMRIWLVVVILAERVDSDGRSAIEETPEP